MGNYFIGVNLYKCDPVETLYDAIVNHYKTVVKYKRNKIKKILINRLVSYILKYCL